jgi:anaerobic selenocysteine-containing dehydrogenase
VAVYGSGVTGHETSAWNVQTILLLNAVTGNIQQRGGYCFPQTYVWDDPFPKPPETHSSTLPGTLFWDLEHGHQEIDGLFTFQSNPAYEDPEPGRTEEILKNEQRIPFHVAMDSCLTETVILADLVLPACTYFERWKLSSGAAVEQARFVSLQQPVVEPLGDSRALEDVLIELSKRLGGDVEKYFPFTGVRNYYEGVARNITDFEAQGGWSTLTKKGFWTAGGEGNDDVWKQGPRVPSQGGKCRLLPIISLGITEHLSISPKALPPEEKVLLLFSVPTHDARTAGSKWLNEIQHASPVWIHPRAAAELGCREGDWVRLKSGVGEIRSRIRLTEGIHPGTIAMEDTGGHRGFGPIAKGKAYKSDDPDTMLAWWSKGVHGENPRSIIPWSKDPHSQGPRWMDTVVRIEKI